MKKPLVFLILLFVAALLISCGSNGYYDKGYEDGYAEGFSDGRLESELEIYDNRFDAGYDAGFEDGFISGSESWFDHPTEIAGYFEDEAAHYAVNHGGLHPEEAWAIIEAYRNAEPFGDDGSPPSTQDYNDAIDSMICFYEYFYSNKYD